MLYSPKGDYKNFRFRAEVKINDHGNSGMYFRSPTNDGDFSKGYEAQIDSTHRDPIRTGSIYGFLHIYKQLVPPDTWFTYEVECVDKDWRGLKVPHIKVWVNGELLFQFIERTKAWDKGYFAFQQHDPGSRIEIRKIEVKELAMQVAVGDGLDVQRRSLPSEQSHACDQSSSEERRTHMSQRVDPSERKRWPICGFANRFPVSRPRRRRATSTA